MKKMFFVLFSTAFLYSVLVHAKVPPQYLRSVYADADVVARVVVLGERELDENTAEYELKVLKPIKGSAGERTLKAVAPHLKAMPADFPQLSDGAVGIIFLLKNKAANGLTLVRFLPAQDFVTSTYSYLCGPSGLHCDLTKFSDVEEFFKKK